ncbi:plasminogen-binding N-terminal domain-containing protein [Sulfurimonas sp.]|uniref:plasminogen-binding N-terminal domain-containing protein n=1 Tax=Sulfurimonas sp. TaxID=2022749 RepID=UPI003565D2E5
MKYIILILVLALQLMAGVVKSPLISVDEQNGVATIKIDKIDVGMSGFIAHNISKEHSVILKNVVVSSYDSNSKIATLKMSPYDALRNNALPSGRWNVTVGDTAILAFGYTRGLLIAPNNDIYHRITKSVKNLQWVHPDIFATILSFNGHPTPLREDFTNFSIATSVGLAFIYLDKKLFTVDAKSFKILTITDAQLKQESTQLPFYTRVEEIDAAWWGEGSSRLDYYEPYYYKLLTEANPDNKELQKIVNNFKPEASK